MVTLSDLAHNRRVSIDKYVNFMQGAECQLKCRYLLEHNAMPWATMNHFRL
jgi:hypothetical protein